MITLETISRLARERNLKHLLAGGHAVQLHGYHRTTADLDLIIRRADREQWRALMLGLEYTLFHESPDFMQLQAKSAEDAPVDLMFSNDATFDQIYADALPDLSGPDRPSVISLRHLLAMKCHAIKHGHVGRIGKDVEDVIHLVMANRIKVEEPRWRDLILKYGPKELYEKLQRTCKS